ncbi:MAG TPA: MFS transporter [Anaerolineae bacterium]|nr:MFS transporter [Anaerolineae bacterium]HXV97232.1 MFS transporter [Anaerolineae bacterium]
MELMGRAALRRLLQLDQPVLPRSESEIAAEVERNYRWNFTFNLLDGVAFWFGWSLASATTIVPLFVSKLTLNPLLIGLIAVIAQAGWYLPQLFTAGQIERLSRKKPVAVNLGFFTERLPTFLWPLAALIAFWSPGLALILFFISYAWHTLGAGLVSPAWQDLFARCFPVDRRGRLLGIRTFMGTGVGAIGAILSSWLLEAAPFPLNFVYLFFIAAVAISISWSFLAQTREPVQPAPLPTPGAGQFRAKLAHILRHDRNFRSFLQARLMLALGSIGAGFITIAVIKRWQVSDSTVGLYTAALLLGQMIGNLLSGLLADRFGHKLSVEIGGAAAMIAFTLAWLAPSAAWYYPVFFCWGISFGITIVSGVLIVLEFSPPAHRPTYIGITNTGLGLANGIAPLLGGWLATFSYNWLFALSAGINLLGLVLLYWQVKEPRWQQVELDSVLYQLKKAN